MKEGFAQEFHEGVATEGHPYGSFHCLESFVRGAAGIQYSRNQP